MPEPRYSISDDKAYLIEIATHDRVMKWSEEHAGYVPLDYEGVCPEGTTMKCEDVCIRYDAATGHCIQSVPRCTCSF
jgi:hypothetical protein